ncbi:MAG: TadE/TadG family type IV pilus assembly protein [Streptosporangiaceae bacterium]|jgi:Flp pilus assembly protein TadG
MKRRPRSVRKWVARRLGRQRDRGSSAIELALLAPVLLLLTMLIIQFALWFQARQAALASAQEGARIAREFAFEDQGTWENLAVSDTEKYYTGLGTKILSGITVTPIPNGGTSDGTPVVGVTVTGKLNSLLNAFGGVNVTVTVEGPEECFHPLDSDGACAPAAG